MSLHNQNPIFAIVEAASRENLAVEDRASHRIKHIYGFGASRIIPIERIERDFMRVAIG